jgi:hypothetical protein
VPSPHLSQQAQKSKTAKPAAKPATSTLSQSGTHSLPGSPAQLLQLQRQYGNQAVQRMIQREAASEPAEVQQVQGQPAIQRVGVNDQETYAQPNEVMGVSTDPKATEDTPRPSGTSKSRSSLAMRRRPAPILSA